MFKIGILLIVTSTSLLFSMDNIFYIKKYIHPSSKLGNPTNNVNYNIFLQYDKVMFDKQNKIGIFYFYMTPYFKNKNNKNIFYVYKKSKNTYNLTEKKRLIKSDKYPKLKIEVHNVNKNILIELDEKIKKIKEKIFLQRNIEEKKRMDLKDSRFDNDSNTMKLGSIIERVFDSAIENQEIDFLKKVFEDEKNNINVVIYDLCYGESKIDSCIENDLYLKLNHGQLKKISSSKLEIKEFKTKKKNHKKLNIKIENIERFQYSDGRYYLYFYDKEKSCIEDKEYKSSISIKESFIDDIETKMIDSQYKWLKGRKIEKCFNGIVRSNQLYFGF